MKVIKRDGREKDFDASRITEAVLKCLNEVHQNDVSNLSFATMITFNVTKRLDNTATYTVEQIQDLVIDELGKVDKVARDSYKSYREERSRQRGNLIDKELQELLGGVSEYWKKENSNKNATLVTTQRDYMAGIVSTDLAKRKLLPKHIVDAHNKGIIHFHDADYYAQQITNCCLINLKDMLDNGTVINGVLIEQPKTFATAMTVATQIITSVSSSQYGGTTITLTHLAPYLRKTKERIRKEVEEEFKGIDNAEDRIKSTYEKRVAHALESGVQTFNYQINSMSNTNGQAPFLTVFMYLGEDKEYTEEIAEITAEFFRQRIEGMKNEQGVPVTQAFPKLIYVLEEQNIHEDSKYWWLTELGAKCTVKRFVPDYISEKVMKELKEGNCFPSMGCRSFLSPWKDEDGNYKFYGRCNIGVVTLSLPDVALSSNGDMNKFWELMEERTELCHEALMCRHKKLEGTLSDVAPILWQHGAFGRLKKGETIDKLLHNGYSSASLGYAGLYECVKYMTGESHIGTQKGKEFGLKVMQFLNDKCDEWNKEHYIGFSVYGTPIESTTYKFAKCLKDRFGIIEGITDKNYITNSYHTHVTQEINPFDKLKAESEFQKLSLGGAISYIECDNLTQNVDSALEVIKYIYENIMYAELNIKSDYCMVCGYDGEMKIDDDFQWYCPNCGNREENKMNVTRRTCGYIGKNYWNKGRTQEIKERYVHLGDTEMEV